MTTWRMPIEGHEQERLWLAWPTTGYTLGDTEAEAEEARRTWAAVANAASDFQPVTVVLNPGDEEIATKYLSGQIDRLVAPLNDAWMRDIGPSFVLGENGELGAVNFVFNGWGSQDWAEWDKDQHIGRIVAEAAGATLIDSEMTNEGGGIQVDGTGRVILTETVQLDPGRNPGWSKEQVEAELARTIGTTSAMWLPRGLTRDHDTFGTRGHSDILAAFASPDILLMHRQDSDAHPDQQIARANREVAERYRDDTSADFEIIDLPAPTTLRDDEGFVDYSYINHLVINGAVLACAFEDRADEQAIQTLREVYPGREVIGIDARPLFARGGGIHCITQQQPKAHAKA
ncbi:agmatine deiminase family protein [Leucobacter insecticola]|uniref:Agmatine deiminase family protein n=1 Tax=Leucobacter insecticola TaxID=2714934 RepID=A0A6G8FIF3_9MICO|nr:agmatine deiminase family protein [Leucobacter insecticola]QIM16144.1 agmatine deiminase family protein [Leucobacter insecticola]